MSIPFSYGIIPLINYCKNKEKRRFTVTGMEGTVFTKEDYLHVLRTERQKFVFTHFKTTLEKLFKDLEQDAKNMKACSITVDFELPEHFDTDKTESILRCYFNDLGYNVISGAQKSNSIVTLTIT